MYAGELKCFKPIFVDYNLKMISCPLRIKNKLQRLEGEFDRNAQNIPCVLYF